MAAQQRKKKVTTIILVIVNFANAKIDIKNSIKNISNYSEFTFDEIDLGEGVSNKAARYKDSNIISKY